MKRLLWSPALTLGTSERAHTSAIRGHHSFYALLQRRDYLVQCWQLLRPSAQYSSGPVLHKQGATGRDYHKVQASPAPLGIDIRNAADHIHSQHRCDGWYLRVIFSSSSRS